MSRTGIILEADFSIERQLVQRRAFVSIGQPTYQLIQILESSGQIISEQTSLFLNPNESLRLPKSEAELLIVRLSPPLLIEIATRLKLYRTGSNLLFSHATAHDQNLNVVLTKTLEDFVLKRGLHATVQ